MNRFEPTHSRKTRGPNRIGTNLNLPKPRRLARLPYPVAAPERWHSRKSAEAPPALARSDLPGERQLSQFRISVPSALELAPPALVVRTPGSEQQTNPRPA